MHHHHSEPAWCRQAAGILTTCALLLAWVREHDHPGALAYATGARTAIHDAAHAGMHVLARVVGWAIHARCTPYRPRHARPTTPTWEPDTTGHAAPDGGWA